MDIETSKKPSVIQVISHTNHQRTQTNYLKQCFQTAILPDSLHLVRGKQPIRVWSGRTFFKAFKNKYKRTICDTP